MASTTTCAPTSSGRRAIHAGTSAGWLSCTRVFHHHELDIRDRAAVLTRLEQLTPAAIVHAAAQPSHASAMAGKADLFVTTDDRLIKKMREVGGLPVMLPGRSTGISGELV